MILEISINETSKEVYDLRESIDYLYGLLQDLEFFDPSEMAAALIVKMYGEKCDIIALTVGHDSLKIRKKRNSG